MSEELEKQWQAMVAKAKADEGYKQRLYEDTLQVLIDEGWDVSNWSKAEVQYDKCGEMILCFTGTVGELGDDELEEVAGGVSGYAYPI